MATKKQPIGPLKLYLIHCPGLGFWNENGEFSQGAKGATFYGSRERVKREATELEYSDFTQGKVVIVTLFMLVLDIKFHQANCFRRSRNAVKRQETQNSRGRSDREDQPYRSEPGNVG